MSSQAAALATGPREAPCPALLIFAADTVTRRASWPPSAHLSPGQGEASLGGSERGVCGGHVPLPCRDECWHGEKFPPLPHTQGEVWLVGVGTCRATSSFQSAAEKVRSAPLMGEAYYIAQTPPLEADALQMWAWEGEARPSLQWAASWTVLEAGGAALGGCGGLGGSSALPLWSILAGTMAGRAWLLHTHLHRRAGGSISAAPSPPGHMQEAGQRPCGRAQWTVGSDCSPRTGRGSASGVGWGLLLPGPSPRGGPAWGSGGHNSLHVQLGKTLVWPKLWERSRQAHTSTQAGPPSPG